MAASCLPIKADWLKLRDQIRVQCNGTGVMSNCSCPSGKWRSICCAITRARPILPPYFNRSATCADTSSYFTAARMPSCRGGCAMQDAQYASAPRSNSKGAAHPRHQGGPRNSNFCQQDTQNGPPAAVIAPQQGQRSGNTQFNILWKMWRPFAISHLSNKAWGGTRAQMHNELNPPEIFDRRRRHALRARAAGRSGDDFLWHHIAQDMTERLSAVTRTFEHALIIGPIGRWQT